MATGMAWFKVPSAIKFNLTGKLPSNCSGKDVILTIIGMIGVDGALYKSMEFVGSGVHGLSMDDRLCICNMAIEAGAKNGIFPVDDVTMEYLNGRSEREPVVYEADADAEYEKVIDIDLAAIVPTVACPHLPKIPILQASFTILRSIKLLSAPALMAEWRIWKRLIKS